MLGLKAVLALSMFGIASPAAAQSIGTIPQDLSIVGMFLQADGIVKAVITILVAASIGTLSICIYKIWEIVSQNRSIATGLDLLARATGLREAPDGNDVTIAAMMQVARQELAHRPTATATHADEAIKERAGALIQRVQAVRQRTLSRGVNILGTIAAAAPFVGLFGTVWGIMNSFIGISKTQTTNLAVVAPGIAEALLATAFGLVAAIPAVLVYNGLTRAIAGYRLRMDDAAVQVMCLLSRELDGSAVSAVQQRNVGGSHGV